MIRTDFHTHLRKRFLINGVVQGVGFRPFVYKLACGNSLCGFAKNDSGGVELEVQGLEVNIALFEKQLLLKLPPLARIDKIQTSFIKPLSEKSFEILQSAKENKNAKTALISPDISTCQECLNDMNKEGKYHNYFALNCTNCGPRYSIIETIPYDRKNTSMKKFGMCKSCAEEYNNPHARRYHAQPISCNDCGPKLSASILETAQNIKSGNIVAIKGIGGFHLVCDATNDEAVAKLRKYKNRPAKPFAIMCKNIEQVRTLASLEEEEENLLSSKEAPIVILKKCAFSYVKLSFLLAPNIDRIGVMLAYTPLHHLLFRHVEMPIVATSANLGDEPIIIRSEDIYEKLPFVDFVLDFDREIINGVDDSVLQVINGKMQTLRLARGYAPKVIKLPFKSEKRILAVGANQKSSIAFVIDDTIILSPHIGDLESIKAFEYFERTIETFQGFYDFEPDTIVHDKHPDYETTKWAKKSGKELVEVQHHLAHIYACKAEFGLRGDYLGFSFDGTGYADGGMFWGGEVFVGDERKYHFKALKLLGGEKAIKEPRRVALSMLFDTLSLEEVTACGLECVKSFTSEELKLLHQSHTKNINAPLSSSVGRLFDAIASFSNIAQSISYEGQSGLLCESCYDDNRDEIFNYTINNGEIEIQIVEFVLNNNYDKKLLCSMFINTLVKIIVDISKKEKISVILSGGVFQNKTMSELLACGFEDENIHYYLQQQTAINDGGIALGQAYFTYLKEVQWKI